MLLCDYNKMIIIISQVNNLKPIDLTVNHKIIIIQRQKVTKQIV